MPSASKEAGQPNRSHPRTAPRDLPPASLPVRSRVVIRLPALTPATAATPIEPVCDACDSALPDSLVAPLVEPAASETFDWAPANDFLPVAPSTTEDMTTFAIPHSSADPILASETDLTPTATAIFAPPPKPAALPSEAPQAKTDEIAITPASTARKGAAGNAFSWAWRLVRQGHAFVMQPKVWLACVLGCFAVLLAAFLSSPSPEPVDSTNPAAAETPVKPAAEPSADVAARIVAPPADMSPAADSRHFEAPTSAGFAGPFGPSPEAERREGAAGEELRIAAEAKLGPGGSRYDGQSPAVERGGAALYDVAPLDRSEEVPSEGSSLR
ncbi:MAG TPA: hypothetical protein VHB99_01755 [Pirellulales bacterium]|nr:hypothetical protein [Pirellulales bacterium]